MKKLAISYNYNLIFFLSNLKEGSDSYKKKNKFTVVFTNFAMSGFSGDISGLMDILKVDDEEAEKRNINPSIFYNFYGFRGTHFDVFSERNYILKQN